MKFAFPILIWLSRSVQRHRPYLAVCIGSCLTVCASAQAPAPPNSPAVAAPAAADPAQVYAAAMAAFQSGDYQSAASKLESVIALAGPDAKLETVYFTLGAAY